MRETNFEDMLVHGDELMHYGRKGMKWYQSIYGAAKNAKMKRKRKAALKKANEARVEKKRQEEAAKKAEAERKEKFAKGKLKVNEMTKEELEYSIARLELEKKYNELSKSPTGTRTADRGKKFANRMLDSTVDKLADQVAADLIAQAVKAVAVKQVNKAFGSEAVYTNNKKKS